MKKILDILYTTEISAIFAYFCPNLVAMVTPFSPLKLQMAYLNSLSVVAVNWMETETAVFCYLWVIVTAISKAGLWN